MKPAARVEYNPSTLYIPRIFSTIVRSHSILPILKRLLFSLYYHFSSALLKIGRKYQNLFTLLRTE
jgi:hypothetical protein